MIYKISKCPYCNKYIDFMSPRRKGFGSPFVKCSNCNKEYITNEIKEIALLNNKRLLWEKLIKISSDLIKILFASILIEIFVSSYIFKQSNGNILITIITFFILLIIFILTNRWDYETSINESMKRLDDPIYRLKLQRAGIDIERKSIYSVRRRLNI